MTTLLLVLAAFLLAALYAVWIAGRLDRLHARVDASWAALDAQLVRRAAEARVLAGLLLEQGSAAGLDAAARAALAADPAVREAGENDLSKQLAAALPQLPPGTDLGELETAATRVGLARSFHNAAVRDTRSIRLRRIPRALRLAGHRSLPQYFEIDDTRLAG